MPSQQRVEQERKGLIARKVASSLQQTHLLPTKQIVQRALHEPDRLLPNDLLTLQHSIGNSAVQRMIAAHQSPGSEDAQAQPQSPVQPKLNVGAANDRYEQEADRIASTVMRHLQPSALQASPESEGESSERPKANLNVQHLSKLNKDQLARTREAGAQIGQAGGAVGQEFETQIQRTRGQGRPLQERTRRQMEASFGTDFSDIHVHANAQSDQLNRSINAEAFTTGKDIYFRQGAYAPEQASGQKLLAHELTHVVQQTGPQAVRRQSNSQAVQVQNRLPNDRISTKRRMMHLDFVRMKRQDANFKRIIGKALGIKMKKKAVNPNGVNDTYGHYWTEVGDLEEGQFGPKASYGWWPKGGTGGAMGAIKGVEGVLNDEEGDHDPHEGDEAQVTFHPVMNVDPDTESYQSIRDRVTTEIENFAHGFSGSWNWRLGWGKNCQTFQDRLKTKVGLHYKSAKEWLRDPEIERRKAEQEKAEKLEAENVERANNSVVGLFTVPEGMNTEAYLEVTSGGSDVRQFREESGGGLRSGGKQVGATGRTAEGMAGKFYKTTMVEYVFENKVYWMTTAYWEMYFGKPYPANNA